MMNRREAIRLLATGAALPLAPRSVLGMLWEARAVVGTLPAPRVMNAHQEATVKAMAEMILPRTDTPGAADVGASEFVDLILAEWYDESERSCFLNGLAEVDVRSRSLFAEDFVDCSLIQQAEILTALGEQVIADGRGPGVGRHGDWSSGQDESFYSMLRRLTLTAYYTSEVGATDELHFQIIPDGYDGCGQVPTNKGARQKQ
jgi:hypothetical protein